MHSLQNANISLFVFGSWIAWTIFSLFIIVLAFRRRHRQPLKARSPTMTFISAVGGYILLTWGTFVYGNVFNAFNIHDENLCSISIWALYIGQPMLLFPYLLRCYRLYFVFHYNIEQNENVRRNQFVSTNSPRRNVRNVSPGRSSPVNGQGASNNIPRSANSSPRANRYIRNNTTISRSNSRNNKMDDLAGVFYDNARTTTMNNNYTDRDYFHKFSYRMSDSWLLQRFLMLLSIFLVYGIVNQVLIIQMPNSNYVRNNVCTHVHLGFVLEWELIEFVEQVIFVLALYQLWDVIDAFNISVELLFIFCIWVAWYAIRVGLAIASSNEGEELWVKYEPLCVIVRSVLLFIVSVLIPLMNSYGISKSEVTLWSFPIALESLDTVLKDHLCMQVFQQYMTQSLAVQHVNFWLSVELYKDIDDDDMTDEYNSERLEEAHRLYAEYVDVDASSPITVLTISERVNIHNELKYGRAPITLFDDAQRTVFSHMETTFFPRFLKSRLYRKLHQKLKIQQRMYGALKANDMINDTV